MQHQVDLRRFFVGPTEAEITGVAMMPGHTHLLLNIQPPASWPVYNTQDVTLVSMNTFPPTFFDRGALAYGWQADCGLARGEKFSPEAPKEFFARSVNAGVQEERSVWNTQLAPRGQAKRQRFPGQRAKPFRRSTQHWELPCLLSIRTRFPSLPKAI